MFEHDSLFFVEFGFISFSKEAHQELITTKDTITEHMSQETRKDRCSLRHVALLVVFIALKALGRWNDYIGVGLDQVVLQEVEIFVFTSNISRANWDLDLVREPVFAAR